MIEQIAPVVLNGRVLSNERAVLDCGCACYVGIRLRTQEPATVNMRCSDDHAVLMTRLLLLLRESTVEPQVGRALVEVADELLEAAAGMEAPR